MSHLLSSILVAGLIASAHSNTQTPRPNPFLCQGDYCVTIPNGCDNISCPMGVRFEMLHAGDPTVNVHVTAETQNKDSYLAVGFSKDGQMGDDALIMCMGPKAQVKTMINPGPAGSHIPPQDKGFIKGTPPSYGITFSEIEKKLDCSFILPVEIDTGTGIQFNLNDGPINVFVVTGTVLNGVPQHHNVKVMGAISFRSFGGNASPSETTTSRSSNANSSSKNTDAKIFTFLSFLVFAFTYLL